MTEVRNRPFFSLRRETGMLVRQGGQIFPRVIRGETSFSLRVNNGGSSPSVKTIVVDPAQSRVLYEKGGGLMVWSEDTFGAVDEQVEGDYRIHAFTGGRDSITLAPQTWVGHEDTSADILEVRSGVSVTVVNFGPHEFQFAVTLPQIVYNFSSPPRG